MHIDCIARFLPSVHWTRSDARISWRPKSAETCRTIVLSTKWAHCWAVVACETDVLHLHRLSPSKYSRISPSTTSVLFLCWVHRFPEATCSRFSNKNSRVSEFRSHWNFEMQINSTYLTRFSMLLRNTSRKSCMEQAPDSTIFITRSDFKNTSWYDWTAFWKASSAIMGVSPFRNAWNRDVIVSNWCFVILIWRRVISVGCFALNGYAMHRETKTYSCMRLLRSSSSRSCRSCNSPSVFSLATDGDGEIGRGNELPLDDAPPALWFTFSCDIPLEGDRFLVWFWLFSLLCVWVFCVFVLRVICMMDAWIRVQFVCWNSKYSEMECVKAITTANCCCGFLFVCPIQIMMLYFIFGSFALEEFLFCNASDYLNGTFMRADESFQMKLPGHFLIRYV